jgi:hypothetical protein
MRFLVWDATNEKLIGLIGLTDPVFNLKVRDDLIGWSSEDRKMRLVNVMDAHVLGAIPPYSFILGGKLVAALIKTREVRDFFEAKYSAKRGIISRTKKRPSLVMVTTTSALGRSSVYNRLKLNGSAYLSSIGYTSGWGHFHVPDTLFSLVREYLKEKNDTYADNHQFGDGPNWRLRAIRKALSMLGISPSLLRHGIGREVFTCSLASNAVGFLQGTEKEANFSDLLSVNQVSCLARDRWISRRAERDPSFASWSKDDLLASLQQETKTGSTARSALVSGVNKNG